MRSTLAGIIPIAIPPAGAHPPHPMTETSLQDRYAPHNACFGCGPANEKGLRLKSVVQGDVVVCDWTPEKHHEAFENMLNGGICGALLDCHSNWTAAWHLMNAAGGDTPPCTVTAEFHVKLRRPTPTVRAGASGGAGGGVRGRPGGGGGDAELRRPGDLHLPRGVRRRARGAPGLPPLVGPGALRGARVRCGGEDAMILA